ncbi:MAG: MFS transporter [Acidobacteriota bacterium]
MKQSFWTRDLALALLGYFFLFLSVTLFYLFPVFLDSFHPSKSRVGLIMGIHSVTAILVRPFFGRMVDERGGRKAAILGTLLMIAVVPFFHLVDGAGAMPLALRALMGAGWGIGMTATMAICSDLAPLDRMAHSIGIIGVAGIVASAVGPMLAEQLADSYGFGVIFNTSLALLSGALICLLATRGIPRADHAGGRGGTVRLARYSLVTLSIIGSMAVVHGAVRGAVVNFIALFGMDADLGRVGPFFLAFSAAAILTRLGMGDISDRYGRKQVILPAGLLVSLNLFWLSQAQSVEVFVLNGFIAGLGQGLIFPALSTYIIDFLGRENKGLALALYLSLFDVGMGLGSPVFGWVSDQVGYRSMYMAAGAFLLITTFVFSVQAPRAPKTDSR